MRPRGRHNRAVVRGYLAEFERRFMRTDAGVVYARPGAATGRRVPEREAASLIAGMRAALIEADEASVWTYGSIWPWLVATPFVLVIIGALTDYMNAAAGLVLPTWVAIVCAGPVLSFIRITFAYRRAVADAERQMEWCESVAGAQVPVNHVRPVFAVVALFAAAVIGGLFVASATVPDYARIGIDRLLGGLLWPLLAIVIAFGLASAYVEARMRRVSEAEIAEARTQRGNRPLG
ncbi:hypothetical protein M9980_11295 [Sphingomonas donggukensis]|uniref:DUF4282 domain-containing protein n=1 Tax=Sphingomonas donggukensis TaxID=2949093 RepID=A0ABY4TRU2_9SPHN|nr:hypothetical protein [Sphingomonas donggukensis]URW75128.1 hypothetical protein M9980_11295 [Sphingomonas donggukensis]